jgi:hypothetical protein
MLLLSVVLIYLIGSAFAVPTHFAGRSGNIIIEPANAINDNSALLLRGEQFDSELRNIEDVRVADLFAHVMGTQPFNVMASREGFPKGNLFNKPKAAFLVTLDSVDPGTFTKYSTAKDYKRVDITTTSYPANAYSMASNIATGTEPSTHGIVGESWEMPNGDKVGAHTPEEGTSLAANLADILTQEWNGQSLTVSASAYSPLAAAFATHPHLVRSNNYALSLNDGKFDSVYGQGSNVFTLDDATLQLILKSPAFYSFLGAKLSGSAINVGSTSATFDINALADYTLFAELGFVYNFLRKLETDSNLIALIDDSTPDFYSFAFASLKSIKAKYGVNSDNFAVAVMMVDSAVQRSFAKLDKFYKGRTVSAVACLDTQTVVSDNVKQIVYNTAKNAFQNQEDFELHFPSLYVQNGDVDNVCANLKAALSNEASVHCFASAYNFVMDDPTPTPTPAPKNNTGLPPLNVPIFWIFVFFPIALLGIILTGVIGLVDAGVSASKDSLLFRSAGRHH